MSYCIGIDLGGTNIAVGICDHNYQIVGRANAKTNVPRPAEEIAQDIYLTSLKALEDAGVTIDQITRIGVGTPGTVDAKAGVVGLAANLGFCDTPLRDLLQARFQKPVSVENDANAAAYGELVAGAAHGLTSMVMVTIGTGIGGGIILGGEIWSGFSGKGGELGHLGMVYEGEACTCGRKGCIEAYCSATALIRITKEIMQKNPHSEMWKLCEGTPGKVSGRTAFEAMRMGDVAAKQAVDQYISYFAYAVSGIINLLQPQAVVIGGGVSKEGETLLSPLRELAYQQSFNHNLNNCTAILQAKLGNDAGVIGAAFLGK